MHDGASEGSINHTPDLCVKSVFMWMLIFSGKMVHDFTRFSKDAVKCQIPSLWPSTILGTFWAESWGSEQAIKLVMKWYNHAKPKNVVSVFAAHHHGPPCRTDDPSPDTHIVLLSCPNRMNSHGHSLRMRGLSLHWGLYIWKELIFSYKASSHF